MAKKEEINLEEICKKLGDDDYRLQGSDMIFCIYNTTSVPCSCIGIYSKTVGLYECTRTDAMPPKESE